MAKGFAVFLYITLLLHVHFSLKIPLLGQAAKQLALSRYFRAFHTLFKAGVPVVRSAEMSAEVTGNAMVSGWLTGAAQSAKMGHPLSEGFDRKFPRDYLNAWQVGEEGGKLEQVTEQLARISTEKAEWLIAEIAKWLPRLIYVIICLWIIRMIFAMWTQVYSIR